MSVRLTDDEVTTVRKAGNALATFIRRQMLQGPSGHYGTKHLARCDCSRCVPLRAWRAALALLVAPAAEASEGLPADLAAVLRRPDVTIGRDREILMADGRSLFDYLRECENAPSNTASAHLTVAPAAVDAGDAERDALEACAGVLAECYVALDPFANAFDIHDSPRHAASAAKRAAKQALARLAVSRADGATE